MLSTFTMSTDNSADGSKDSDFSVHISPEWKKPKKQVRNAALIWRSISGVMGRRCYRNNCGCVSAWDVLMPLRTCANLGIAAVGGGGRPSRICSWRTPDR